MYHRYFGMKHRPFTATPQIGSCYPAPTQEEALATLHYALSHGRGIAVLTGLPGTGKTLVCHRLTTNLEPAFTTAMITNTHMPTVKGLLQAILYDLSLPFHGLDEQELRLTLTDFLLGKYAGGGRTVLVIDEAQNLAVPLLEELRMLSNLEGESDKLFQIVLAGHPRLLQLIRSPELETLSQRVGARATLAPLSDEETVAYIQYQLECAGVCWDKVFLYEAMCAVHEVTNGIPRLISQLCDHALLRAYVTDVRLVDRTTVMHAKSDLEESTEHRKSDARAIYRAAPSIKFETEVFDLATQSESQFHQTAETFVACTECEGSLETVQISTDHALEEAASLSPEQSSESVHRLLGTSQVNEGFAEEEEIVVDPYAMMDAARMTPYPTKHPFMVGRAESTTAMPVLASTMPDRQSQITEQAPGQYDQSLRTLTGTTEAILPDALFVESGDNPAVHEVGAGIVDRTNDGTESPLLIIENRQQRIGSHIARVDSPQQPGRDNRGYRRLFTHARKS